MSVCHRQSRTGRNGWSRFLKLACLPICMCVLLPAGFLNVQASPDSQQQSVPMRQHPTTTVSPQLYESVGSTPRDTRRSDTLQAATTRTYTGTTTLEQFICNPSSQKTMPSAKRRFHTATSLTDGTVLLVGGYEGYSNFLASAEIYDPVSATFKLTGSMSASRYDHTATLLQDGRVLITGGNTGQDATSSAEVYDPASGTFTVVGAMKKPRSHHTATRLSDGRVLIVGGYSARLVALSSAEVFDPLTNTFTAVGSMAQRRFMHTATLLDDDTLLIAGGFNYDDQHLASAELYDPKRGTFRALGDMIDERYRHTATLLQDGRVLMAGGYRSVDAAIRTAEIYDPATFTFIPTTALLQARFGHTATLLPGGRVVFFGGYNGFENPTNVEVFDPTTQQYTSQGAPRYKYVYHTATVLNNGAVLIVGEQTDRCRMRRYTFSGTLTVPSGWITNEQTILSFSANAKGTTIVQASIIRNQWVQYSSASGIQPIFIQTLREFGDIPISLYVRDGYGVTAKVVDAYISIDLTTPTTILTPLPAYSSPTVNVSWEGIDATSGVASYDLEVWERKYGQWRPLLTATTATSTTFQGEPGQAYRFRVRARDVAGNIESFGHSGEGATRILNVTPSPTTTPSPSTTPSLTTTPLPSKTPVITATRSPSMTPAPTEVRVFLPSIGR